MRSNKIILTGRRIRNNKDLSGRGLSRGPSSSDWKNVCQSVVNSCRQEHWLTKTRPRYNVFQALLLISHFTTALVVVKGSLLEKSIWFQWYHTTHNAELKTPPAKICVKSNRKCGSPVQIILSICLGGEGLKKCKRKEFFSWLVQGKNPSVQFAWTGQIGSDHYWKRFFSSYLWKVITCHSTENIF